MPLTVGAGEKLALQHRQPGSGRSDVVIEVLVHTLALAQSMAPVSVLTGEGRKSVGVGSFVTPMEFLLPFRL